MWVYLTDEFSGSPRMVLFQYERTRAGYHPVEFLDDDFLEDFNCEGYQTYHNLQDRITLTGCMTYARRRFDEVLTILRKGFTKGLLKETTAYQAMARIGILYKIEELIRDKTSDGKYKERLKVGKTAFRRFLRVTPYAWRTR